MHPTIHYNLISVRQLGVSCELSDVLNRSHSRPDMDERRATLRAMISCSRGCALVSATRHAENQKQCYKSLVENPRFCSRRGNEADGFGHFHRDNPPPY